MKLLIISHSCATPTNQDLFARVEQQTGWTLVLIIPRVWKTEYGERPAERLSSLRAKLRPVPVTLNGSVPLHFYRASLARILREERPDLIYVQHDPHALATMQVFLANRLTLRVPIAFKNDQNIPKRYPWPIRVGERFVYREAAFALAPAEPAAEVLREKGYRGPVTVVPYSIDLSLYRPRTERAQGEPLVVGYVGRLVPEKGVDTILRALGREKEDIRALIVGSGPSEPDLRALAEKLAISRRVEWRGYVDHRAVPQVFGEMDLLVVPSRTTPNWREQFGRVVIESLACGVPVCSSDSGEPPTLVRAMEGGWTFPEGDADALAALLAWAEGNRDELRRTANVARARVRKSFSSESVAACFVDAVRRYGVGERRTEAA